MIERLVQSLRALAAPAHLQLERFPNFVCKPDELALDYADALLLASDCPQLQLTDAQQRALRSLDDLLAEMSGTENLDLWTEAALSDAPEWVNVRRAASAALAQLECSYEPPGQSSATYIPGKI
jgi:hypothetical protein